MVHSDTLLYCRPRYSPLPSPNIPSSLSSYGHDWLPRWVGVKAHLAPFDTLSPCLVAQLAYFVCALSFIAAPPSWPPPSSRRDLHSRARTARRLVGTLGAVGRRRLHPTLKSARTGVGVRVTASIPPLSCLHCSGAPSLLPSRRWFVTCILHSCQNLLGSPVLRLVYLALPLFSPYVSYHEILVMAMIVLLGFVMVPS